MSKVKQEIRISPSQLVNVLMGINTPQFVGMETETPVKMKKFLNYWLVGENGKRSKNPDPTTNPFIEDGILNRSRKYKIITGFDYENSVNGRLEKEGKDRNFESKGNWFNVVSKGLVVNKKNDTQFYFRYQYLEDSTLETKYTFEGDLIEKRMFQEYMEKKSTYSNQGLADTLKFQVVKVENIKNITINGVKYIVI